MERFAQHVTVTAAPGRRDELLAKFVETLDFLADEPACELTMVSTSPEEPDAVILTEVWRSTADHTAAVQSDHVQRWAVGMDQLTAGPPRVQVIEPADATFLRRSTHA
jgi:quinol monooxygenase YgiN